MPTSNNNTHEDKKPAAKKPVQESGPQFRSVDIARPPSIGLIGGHNDVIDKQAYFGGFRRPEGAYLRTEDKKPAAKEPASDRYTPWSPTEVRQVPAFYPLERSSRFVEADLDTVVSRTSEANRLLSIHAEYCNKTATATLLTSENVEMHLSLWKPSAGDKEGIVIEIQRRKGDSITFHRYSRCILDAVAGDLDISDHVEKNGDDIDAVFSRKVQRMLTLEAPQDSRTETENAIIAIEIAHGLIMKDRIDANQLGLESLCLLTDAKKTGLTTAVIASRVVLLGSARDVTSSNSSPEEALLCDETPFQEIRQALLSLIQFRRIGDGDDFGDASSDEPEHITVLHNLALAVLANALDVISNEEIDTPSASEDVPAVRNRLDTSESISEQFLDESLEFSESRDIMKTLISELGKAGMKPHNACLSAKCIGSLCKASEKARKKAEELGAKTVVQTALEVGTRTHLKLQRECSKVLTSLTRQNNDE